MLAAAGGITTLALVLTLLVSREISRSLGRISAAVERIADDDLDVTVEGLDRLDEIGVMSRSVEVLRRNAAEAARAFGENLRIKVALDNASANVMVADTAGRIVYVNESGKALLRAAADDLRTAIPGHSTAASTGRLSTSCSPATARR
jgi:methyl-accepting chemotaxis protein